MGQVMAHLPNFMQKFQTVIEIFLSRRQAEHRDILLAISMRLLGASQTPDRPFHRQSNTPSAWLLSLPLVAPSRTSAQETIAVWRTIFVVVPANKGN